MKICLRRRVFSWKPLLCSLFEEFDFLCAWDGLAAWPVMPRLLGALLERALLVPWWVWGGDLGGSGDRTEGETSRTGTGDLAMFSEVVLLRGY